MYKKILAAFALCFSMAAANAVPVTVNVTTDAYADEENGWLIFTGSPTGATDLTTDTVAIDGLTVAGPLSFNYVGLSTTLGSETTTIDLAAGVYTLFVADAFGDGMTCESLACGDGSYQGGFQLLIDGIEDFSNFGDGTYGQRFHEFTIEAAVVAEPHMLALFGLGLAGIGFASRRRRSA